MKKFATFHNFVVTQNERDGMINVATKNECCYIMVIKRHNFVATMDFCVATLIEKFMKKNGAILFCSVATMIKQMAVEFCHNNQIFVAT